MGMDLSGFFVQFSFVVDLPMSAREFLSARKRATARYEQDVFALPWRVEEVVAVVTRYAMEPSAGATLLQLACLSFGGQEVKNVFRMRAYKRMQKDLPIGRPLIRSVGRQLQLLFREIR